MRERSGMRQPYMGSIASTTSSQTSMRISAALPMCTNGANRSSRALSRLAGVSAPSAENNAVTTSGAGTGKKPKARTSYTHRLALRGGKGESTPAAVTSTSRPPSRTRAQSVSREPSTVT